MKSYEQTTACTPKTQAEQNRRSQNDEPRQQAGQPQHSEPPRRDRQAQNKQAPQDRQPQHTIRQGEPVGIKTVTQITPDDILSETGPIAPTEKHAPVSQEKVEEDVVTINPSVESMSSRG